jgi:uncharacterized protein (TIGR02118 family)
MVTMVTMVKLTVLFGHPEDPEAFEKYYANQHLPLAAKIPNVQRFESGRMRAVDDGAPLYHRIAEVWFENAERMGEALSSPEGEAATGDLPNFATGGATFVVSEVEA